MEARLAAIEQQLAAGGGAGAGGVEPIKPKIDVNVVLLQLLKMVAKLCDAQGVPISASEMVQTQDDLTQFGMAQEGTGGGGVTEGGAGGAGGGSAIAPISPMQGASPELAKGASHVGAGYSDGGFAKLSGRAAMMAAVLKQRRSTNAA